VEFFPDVEDWPSISDCTPGKEETEEVEVGDEGDTAESPNL
jgi:hypothetical protein